jgi:hypothetical protein
MGTGINESHLNMTMRRYKSEGDNFFLGAHTIFFVSSLNLINQL